MKKNIFYGLMLAFAFLMSSASFASPYTNDYGYISQNETFTMAEWIPAAIDVAMATSGGNRDKGTAPCMAGCKTLIDGDILANWRYDYWAMYASFKITDNHRPLTVLARRFTSEPVKPPTRIPIAV